MDQNRKLAALRVFFVISNASFEFRNAIQNALGHPYTSDEMHALHKLALVELEKETPDLSVIDDLLQKMEIQSGIDSTTIKNPESHEPGRPPSEHKEDTPPQEIFLTNKTNK